VASEAGQGVVELASQAEVEARGRRGPSRHRGPAQGGARSAHQPS
jgi:hypothetical protein